MRILAALVATALCSDAAVLQGIVLDFESGRALARTTVILTPLQTVSGVSAQSVRSESNGSFYFDAPAGTYLLTLQRAGFAPFRYGAHCGTCPGGAIYLSGSDRTVIDVRMHRLGAITGTIFDENQIGIPGIPVNFYTATRPLHHVGQAISDDRGVFRMGQLAPGPYIVRTSAILAPDGASYLASFYPEGTDMKYVRSVPAELDRTWTNVDFTPVPGKLYRVRGKLIMEKPGITNAIELITDAGRQKTSVDAAGNFMFNDVAPGNYEFFAEGHLQEDHYGAWQLYTVEHDSEVMVPMPLCPVVRISLLDDHKPVGSTAMNIVMRRKDLDKEGPEIALRPGLNDLTPGDWEMRVVTADQRYPVEFRLGFRRLEMRSKDPADWVVGQVPLGPTPKERPVPLTISLSSRAATLTGRVTDRPNEPAAYAPVLLETIGLEPPDPVIQREARAAADGSFQFTGLPPGKYRLLASFDLDWSDRIAVDTARPLEVPIAEAARVTQDLSLYHKP